MSKAHIKIIGFILLITTVADSSRSKNQYETEKNAASAKRSLLEREHEYFKTQPMSAELRSFIEKYRKKKDNKNEVSETENEDVEYSEKNDKRRKRSQGLDESLLYMIQNGQLVPVKTMKEIKRSEEEDTDKKIKALDSYTVVPLVIPIGEKDPISKLIKTRTLDEELQNAQLKNVKSSDSITASSTSAPLENQQSSNEPRTNEENEENSTNNSTQEDKVLHKILEDVEGLMQWKHEGNKKEGVICNLNGSWISDAAGMRFDICYKNTTRKKFRIHLADRIPPNEDGFLCDGNWTLFGELPFTHSGMVIVLAVHEKDKHIATFIGECRTCEGSETVTGTWLIGRSSRDCKDQKASHKILSDVWRREQGHTLRKKHLEQIGYTVKDEAD